MALGLREHAAFLEKYWDPSVLEEIAGLGSSMKLA